MDAKSKFRLARGRVVGLVLLVFFAGCESAGKGLPFRPFGWSQSKPADAAPSDTWTGKNSAARPDGPPMADDRWALAAPGASAQYHWRHPRLEAQAASLGGEGEWTRGLSDDNPVAAANAAILLSRSQSAASAPAVNERLAQSVRNGSLRPSLRAAAAESLRSPDPSTLPLVRELVDQFGTSAAAGQAGYQPSIHAALLASLAVHVPADADERFLSALKSASAEVRVVAVRAWALPGPSPLPQAVIDLAADPDAGVRATVARVIGERRPAGAHAMLSRAVDDFDLSVRTAAIAALGRLGTAEARATLERLRSSRSELARTAVVTALATMGADREVAGAAADRSWRVREAVAQAIALIPEDAKAVGKQTRALAKDLVRDVSTQVQQRAVASLATWPLVEAGPVLLAAIEDGGYETRKAAAAQLAKRWPPAAEYPIDAPPERRREALAELRRRWNEQFGTLGDAALASLKQRAAAAANLSPEQLEQVASLVRQLSDRRLPDRLRKELMASLSAFGPDLVAALEELALRESLPPEIYTDLLPGLSPVFAELARLSSSDVRERRAAAAALVAQAAGKPLSELALARLADVVALENDATVWKGLLQAIAADARETASRMAYAGIGHASSEVRRLAANHLAAYADARHMAVLLPVLSDPSAEVVVAAIRAVRAIGQMDDPRPLVDLLTASNKFVRLEAAISLASMRVGQGRAALERLARETDQEIRQQVAAALGDVGDPSLLPTLILLLNDRPEVQRAAMASLALLAGKDIARGQGVQPPSTAEQARMWQDWYRAEYGALPTAGAAP